MKGYPQRELDFDAETGEVRVTTYTDDDSDGITENCGHVLDWACPPGMETEWQFAVWRFDDLQSDRFNPDEAGEMAFTHAQCDLSRI